MRNLKATPETRLLLSPYRDEKDSQGENMFLRCVSELVIESREVCWFLCSPACGLWWAFLSMVIADTAQGSFSVLWFLTIKD